MTLVEADKRTLGWIYFQPLPSRLVEAKLQALCSKHNKFTTNPPFYYTKITLKSSLSYYQDSYFQHHSPIYCLD